VLQLLTLLFLLLETSIVDDDELECLDRLMIRLKKMQKDIEARNR